MTPIPLGELRLWPSHHRSALWWLGLLYRRPRGVNAALMRLPRGRAIVAGIILYLHALPWMLLIMVLGRLLLFGVFDLPMIRSLAPLKVGPGIVMVYLMDIAFGITFGITFGIAYGIVFGIGSIAFGIAYGIVFGIVFGIGYGTGLGIHFEITFGIAVGITYGIIFGIIILEKPDEITDGIAMGYAYGIVLGVVSIGFGSIIGIRCGIILGIVATRAYYLPVHVLFVWPAPAGRRYRLHPVAWDDLCSVPFPGLCRLLVAYAEVDRARAEAEIDRLIDTYPSQRREALRARALLTAQDAAAIRDLARIDEPVYRLSPGDEDFLVDVFRLWAMVDDLAQAQRRLDVVQVPAFREPLAAELVTRIRNFRDQAAGLRWPLSEGFRNAAEAWLRIAERQLDEARRVLDSRPAPQLFRAGDPVDRRQEAFVPRLPALEELQGQITLSLGCSGILLYGRRRMGKSTLIQNLQPFLPTSILVKIFSMQDPRVFSSLNDLLSRLVLAIGAAAAVVRSSSNSGDLSRFFAFLGLVGEELERVGKRLLIAIDEYENIDVKIGEGVFPRDLLDMLRESIQHHRRIVWLFAGSHDIAELRHAEWPSWFVSLRTVELLPFTPEETRLLLTEPLRHSELYRDRPEARPRFPVSFWGEGGIERIQAEAAGWPHLVQLLAEGVVELVNLRGLRAATPELLEEAIQRAVVRGDAVLRQLVRNESRLPGEWDYLKGFRTLDRQPPPADEAVYQSLRRRLMVAAEDGTWRMRVPLMQRWLRERG